MLKIGEFSKLSRVSVRMLRHYDEIGLLKPAEIDRFTDYRYYREDQLPIAKPLPYSSHIKTQLLSETTNHFSLFFRFGNAASIQSTSSSGVISPREHASRFCIASYRQRLKSASLICRTLTRAEYLL